MFRCNKCKHKDEFELMFSPEYKGEKNFSVEYTPNNDLKITVDGFVFVPDSVFMNHHAVCKYCGNINCWDYDI